MRNFPKLIKVPKNISKNRIVFLDYLRVFAFSSVLIGHKFIGPLKSLINSDNLHATAKITLSILLPLSEGGGAGVVVFFLVSGYIITHVLLYENPIEFAIKRIFRIYPLYIVAVFLQLLLDIIDGDPIPHLGVIVSQLLLIGDFFKTPLTLGGVEWTLRIEIFFYIFMGLLKFSGVFRKRNLILPVVLTLTTILLGFLAPYPTGGWTIGYFSMYAPFLFIGVMFYLWEKEDIKISVLAFFIMLVFFQYFILISKYQAKWLDDHFAILALLLFFLTWFLRFKIPENIVVRQFSELTYSVYLFHNWIWEPMRSSIKSLSISKIPIGIQTLFILLIFCMITNRLVENNGIRIGKKIVLKYQKKKEAQNSNISFCQDEK
jgi:peptidoglycan/LPS O-acetylase OafA/YrhL